MPKPPGIIFRYPHPTVVRFNCMHKVEFSSVVRPRRGNIFNQKRITAPASAIGEQLPQQTRCRHIFTPGFVKRCLLVRRTCATTHPRWPSILFGSVLFGQLPAEYNPGPLAGFCCAFDMDEVEFVHLRLIGGRYLNKRICKDGRHN